MVRSYKKILPVILLISGVILLGLAISLNIYSYFYSKQGEITIVLSNNNNYSVIQPLFFNYHGYVEIILMESEDPRNKVYLTTDIGNYTLSKENNRVILILGRGGHKLFFNSNNSVIIKLKVEDFLILPGENNLLLLVGTSLTITGIVLTAYYAKKKLLPLR